MTRSLVLIPRDGDRQFLTKEQAEELLAGVPDYVEPVAVKPAVEPVVPGFHIIDPDANIAGCKKSRRRRMLGSFGRVVFDDRFVDDNEEMFVISDQEYFIDYFNRINRCMACLPDYFAAGLANDHQLISTFQKSPAFGSYIHNILCGDRFLFHTDFRADIFRPFGSTVVNPQTVLSVRIPDYSGGVALSDILNNLDGVIFVRKLFWIDDSIGPAAVENAFLNLTGRGPNSVIFYTPSLESRKVSRAYVASISFYDNRFIINCDYSLYSKGCSRGVCYIPKKGGARP